MTGLTSNKPFCLDIRNMRSSAIDAVISSQLTIIIPLRSVYADSNAVQHACRPPSGCASGLLTTCCIPVGFDRFHRARFTASAAAHILDQNLLPVGDIEKMCTTPLPSLTNMSHAVQAMKCISSTWSRWLRHVAHPCIHQHIWEIQTRHAGSACATANLYIGAA